VPAYVIAEIEVTDPEAYDEYRRQVPATLEPYGATFRVRGGEITPLEGGWEPKRLVILEFPSSEQAKAWYYSDAYREPMALRQRASIGRLVLVEGV
jgi:uncharacterized protein (DUF1330 family)